MGLLLLQLWLNQKRKDHNLVTFLPQTSDYPNELETNEFLNQAEKTHSKTKINQDFIKKNIEVSIKA